MSENQSRTNSTPSCSIRACTSRRESSLDVALFLVSTCAMNSSLKREKPQAQTRRPRLHCLTAGLSLYGDAVRLLVTGGAGFIGSHFVKRMLAAGEDVVVLDKFTYAGNPANLPGDAECHRGDIAVREDVDQIGRVDAIVNFAAETHVDRSILGPEEFVRTDVLGTLVLLQAAEEMSARLVQVSTAEVYGDVEPGWSSREDDPLRPSSPYSASKAGGDLQVLSAVRTFGVNASITRGSNTYGPNQYPEKILPLFVTNAPDGEHENVELTNSILELTGADRSLVRHVEDRLGHDRRYSLETTKLRKLGWSPQRSWEDGIRATVEWYRDNREWWEPIKRSGGYRDYYEQQYADRLA